MSRGTLLALYKFLSYFSSILNCYSFKSIWLLYFYITPILSYWKWTFIYLATNNSLFSSINSCKYWLLISFYLVRFYSLFSTFFYRILLLETAYLSRSCINSSMSIFESFFKMINFSWIWLSFWYILLNNVVLLSLLNGTRVSKF